MIGRFQSAQTHGLLVKYTRVSALSVFRCEKLNFTWWCFVHLYLQPKGKPNRIRFNCVQSKRHVATEIVIQSTIWIRNIRDNYWFWRSGELATSQHSLRKYLPHTELDRIFARLFIRFHFTIICLLFFAHIIIEILGTTANENEISYDDKKFVMGYGSVNDCCRCDLLLKVIYVTFFILFNRRSVNELDSIIIGAVYRHLIFFIRMHCILVHFGWAGVRNGQCTSVLSVL